MTYSHTPTLHLHRRGEAKKHAYSSSQPINNYVNRKVHYPYENVETYMLRIIFCHEVEIITNVG
jgi:hypothetical protein